MAVNALEVRRSSASLWGGGTGARTLPTISKYIDTSTCIGCKACEVSCQEWNDLPTVETKQTGSYQTMPDLHAGFWNLIRFNEQVAAAMRERVLALDIPHTTKEALLGDLQKLDDSALQRSEFSKNQEEDAEGADAASEPDTNAVG